MNKFQVFHTTGDKNLYRFLECVADYGHTQEWRVRRLADGGQTRIWVDTRMISPVCTAPRCAYTGETREDQGRHPWGGYAGRSADLTEIDRLPKIRECFTW